METLFLAFGATLIIGAGAGGALAILYPFIRPGLLRRQPWQRSNVLLGWAVAPVSVGLFFTSLLFIPSLLNRLGVPAGHCHNHAERFPHICLTNPLFSGAETLPWYLVMALTALLTSFLVAQGAHLHKSARLKAALRCAGHERGAEYNLIHWKKPSAFTVGFLAPQIFISRTLSEALPPEHFQVILTHERGHVRRRDPLRQYLGRALSLLHLPRTRQRILDDLTLAIEQACDEDAAQQTGDRLQVAETIVSVERLLLHHSQRALEAGAVGFAHNNSALRIKALLAEGAYQDPSIPGWVFVFTSLAVTSLVMPGPVHHLAELFIRH